MEKSKNKMNRKHNKVLWSSNNLKKLNVMKFKKKIFFKDEIF